MPTLLLGRAVLCGRDLEDWHVGVGRARVRVLPFALTIPYLKWRCFPDQIPTTLPRKLSLSSMQSPISPRDPGMPSPRVGRMATGFDGVLGSSGGDTSWSARRRASEAAAAPKTPGAYRDPGTDVLEEKIKEEDEPPTLKVLSDPLTGVPLNAPSSRGTQNLEPSISRRDDVSNTANNAPPPGLHDPSSAQWAYLDPQGNVQGELRLCVGV